MTSLLNLLDRFENAAGVYERSDDPAERDELHAARRAIMEREAELVKALEVARRSMPLNIGASPHVRAAHAIVDAAISKTPPPENKAEEGRRAYQSGLPREDNPYPQGSSGYWQWSSGWLDEQAFRAARAALNPSLEQE